MYSSLLFHSQFILSLTFSIPISLINCVVVFFCSKRRLDLLQDLRWSHGSLSEHVKSNITPQELDFSKAYNKLLGQYMRSREMRGVGLDLTAVRKTVFFLYRPWLKFIYLVLINLLMHSKIYLIT